MKSILALLSLCCAFTTLHAGLDQIEEGATADEVRAEMGEPQGKMGRDDLQIWQYPEAVIKLKKGKVFSIEPRSSSPAASGSTEAQSRQPRQRNTSNQAAKVQEIRDDGAAVDMDTVTVDGSVTIVDFFADWCGPCRRVSPMLEQIAQRTDGVVVRKIEIVTWDRPVVRQYGIQAIPHILVFDREGKLVGQPTGNPNLVYRYVQDALGE